MTDLEINKLLTMLAVALEASVHPNTVAMRLKSAIASGDTSYLMQALASDIQDQEIEDAL